MLDIFQWFSIPLDVWIENGVDWVVTNWRPFFQAIRWPVNQVLSAIRDALLFVPPSIMLVLIYQIA